MPIWRQPNGKIYRNPLTCAVVNCDVSPCGQSTACCDDAISNSLTLSWTSDDLGGGPGEMTLTWDAGDARWEGTASPGSAANDISLTCTGVPTFVLSNETLGLDFTAQPAPAPPGSLGEFSCDPLLITYDEFEFSGLTVLGVSIAETA
jgi:hypothetical protein